MGPKDIREEGPGPVAWVDNRRDLARVIFGQRLWPAVVCEWIFCGKLDDQYRQIGNAVPCVFGEAVARHLISFDEGRKFDTSMGRMSRYTATDHASWRESVSGLDRQLVLYE